MPITKSTSQYHSLLSKRSQEKSQALTTLHREVTPPGNNSQLRHSQGAMAEVNRPAEEAEVAEEVMEQLQARGPTYRWYMTWPMPLGNTLSRQTWKLPIGLTETQQLRPSKVFFPKMSSIKLM